MSGKTTMAAKINLPLITITAILLSSAVFCHASTTLPSNTTITRKSTAPRPTTIITTPRPTTTRKATSPISTKITTPRPTTTRRATTPVTTIITTPRPTTTRRATTPISTKIPSPPLPAALVSKIVTLKVTQSASPNLLRSTPPPTPMATAKVTQPPERPTSTAVKSPETPRPTTEAPKRRQTTQRVTAAPTRAQTTGPADGSFAGVTPGHCQFPVTWRRGRQWWRGYANHNTQISESGLDYVYETFSTRFISTFKKSDPNQQIDTYKCVAAGRKGENYVYVLIKEDKIYCREYAQGDGMLLLRWISVGNLPGRIPSIDECANSLSSMSSYEVLPLFNPQTGEVTVRECPMTSGLYRTIVIEQTSLGKKTYCENRADSQTTIDKAKMDIETCLRADSYDKPYYSYLYCVADWEGNLLGDNFGSAAASDKSVLLLYQNKNTNERPHFYVGRYRHSGGRLLMSLYVADVRSISGLLTSTADQSSSSYKNFVFTRIGDVPSDKPGVSETENPISARCVGGCLNGVCQQGNIGKWTCNCKTGYRGKSCERALTSGSCAKSPCVNGLCEQHGSFYYCGCTQGWTGLNCDVGQYCLPNPCKFGECELFQGGYKCVCPDGFTGRDCAENVVAEAQEDKTILITLTTLLSIFVVGIVIVSIVICQCRRKNQEKLIPANPDGDLPNQTYSSMTSWFPTYKRELAASEELTSSP